MEVLMESEAIDDYLSTLLDIPIQEDCKEDKVAYDMMIRSIAEPTKPSEVGIFPDEDVAILLETLPTQDQDMIKNGLKDDEKEVKVEPLLPAPSSRKKKKSMTQRYREEKAYLDRRITVLQKTLDGLKRKRSLQESLVTTSSWEAQAREEAVKRQKAVEVNNVLRNALEQQLNFAKSLEKVMEVLPGNEMPGIAELSLDSIELGDSHEQRLQSMHSIVDKVYEKFMREFDSKPRIIVKREPTKGLEESRVSLTEQLEIKIEVDDVFRRNYKQMSQHFCAYDDLNIGVIKFSSLQKMDDQVDYKRKTVSAFCKYGGPVVSSNVISKIYLEEKRVVVAWTSVPHDTRFPIDPQHEKHEESGYIVFENLEGDTEDMAHVQAEIIIVPALKKSLKDERCLHAGATTENILSGIRDTLLDFRKAMGWSTG